MGEAIQIQAWSADGAPLVMHAPKAGEAYVPSWVQRAAAAR